jgi:hypothetical protein
VAKYPTMSLKHTTPLSHPKYRSLRSKLQADRHRRSAQQPTANSQQPTANSQQPTANSQQPTANYTTPQNNSVNSPVADIFPLAVQPFGNAEWSFSHFLVMTGRIFRPYILHKKEHL